MGWNMIKIKSDSFCLEHKGSDWLTVLPMHITDNSIDVSNLPFTHYCFGTKVYKAVHQTYYLQSHDPMLSIQCHLKSYH
jgi:hypothetical protein